MTVSATTSVETFACDGVTVAFTCPFRVLDAQDMRAYLIEVATGAVTELANGSDFTVSGVGAANAIVTTAETYSASHRLKCKRKTSRLQETDYRDNDPFPAESHERALDRLTMFAQEDEEAFGRALLAPESETMSTLPDAASRADKLLSFDSNGNPVVAAPADGSSAALAVDLASSSSAAKGAGMSGFGAGMGYPADTVGGKLTEWLSLRDCGGVCDGTTDDSAAYDLLRTRLAARGQTTAIINADSLVHGHILPAGLHTVMVQEFATIGTDNKIANPTFAAAASGWTLGVAWAHAGAPDRIVHTAGTASDASCSGVEVEKGELYQLQVTIATTTSGVVNFKVGTQDLFATEKRFFNAARSALVAGDWFSTTPVATVGTETSPGVGLEQLKPVSASTWYYTFVPLASGTVDFTIQSDDRWGGSISSVKLVKVAAPLRAASTISTDLDTDTFYKYGLKVSQANYGVIGLGDEQTAALINGFGKSASEGALNVAIGERAMRSTFDGVENTAVGTFALQYGEGSGNTAVGYSALKFSIKGMENTAVGYKSQVSGTLGLANTSLGFQSLFYNAEGSQNVAIGHRALKWNLAGDSNTAVGYSAGTNSGGNNNTEIGREAGSHLSPTSAFLYTYDGVTALGFQAQVYGSRSTAMGYTSRVGVYDSGTNTTHSYEGSVAIGDAARVIGASSVAIGDGCVIGSYAGAAATPATKAVAIGAANTVTANEAVVVGNASDAVGSRGIAIGTDTHATGARGIAIGVSNGAGDDGIAMGLQADARATSVSIGYRAGAATSGAHTGSGNTSVGEDAGRAAGNAFSNTSNFGKGAVPTASNQVTLGNASVATLRCQVTTITALSDERDKREVEPLPLGLDFINTIRPVRFKWAMRDGTDRGDGYEAGVIAQELQAAQQAAGADWLGLVLDANPGRLEATPGKLLFPLIRAVQELAAQNAALVARVEALEGK